MSKKNENEVLSLINDIITRDDINFNDIIVIFKKIPGELSDEEELDIINQVLYEGGYELKTMKYQNNYQKSENDYSFKEKKVPNTLINSLSDLNNINNNLIIMCISPINIRLSITQKQKFDSFWTDTVRYYYNEIENIQLIYYSNTKIRGLLDSQYMFPELFKVKHIFQLIISKSENDNNNFVEYLNKYKKYLLYNSIYVAENKIYNKVFDLRLENESNISTIKNKNKLFSLTKNFENLQYYYLENEKFQKLSCAITHLTYIGNNDSLKKYSSEVAFNDNFFILNYDRLTEYDELIKLFVEFPEEIAHFIKYSDISNYSSKYFSTYQRIMIIFKPFICKNNLNDILLNVFKVNSFNVLHREYKVLDENDIKFLYFNECPNNEIPFNTYHRMMSEANCEIVLLTKFRGFAEAHAILGSNTSSSNKEKSKIIYNKNFINIYSLINAEIMKAMKKGFENEKFNNNYFYERNYLQKDLMDFSSKINFYFYLNSDPNINEIEINFFCPDYCYMQDLILICSGYSQKLEETLISFKYEVLDKCYYRFNGFEIEKIFGENFKNIKAQDLDIIKKYFLKNDICLMRVIKPGSMQEFQNIFLDKNKFFQSFIDNNIRLNSNNFSESNDYFDNQYEFLRKNCYLVTSVEIIEYLYPIINEDIYKIEGNVLINKGNNPQKRSQILKILKACLKNTVGEDIRGDGTPYKGENDSIIHRYIHFYHQDYNDIKKKSNNYNNYFMSCLDKYFNSYCKIILNKPIGTMTISQHYSEICERKNNMDVYNEILQNNFSFIVESNNLGFYEVRITLLNLYTKDGWSYMETDKYLLTKYYLYSDNSFYEELALKNQDKNILVMELPFIENIIETNNSEINVPLTDNVKDILNKYIGENYKYKDVNNPEEVSNIIKHILFKTKFESNKIFNKRCASSDFIKSIVPRSYHYRIEPNKLSMNLNRIYEVEEYTGLTFMEIVVQEYMKYRPTELNKKTDEISARTLFNNKIEFKGSQEKQFPLTSMLFGRKLYQICKIVEEQKNSLEYCNNYGPIIYVPIENCLCGIIDKNFIKEYEIYLYLNTFEDIKKFINDNLFDFSRVNKDEYMQIQNSVSIKREMYVLMENIEKKLYEIFNSEIFDITRKNLDNIRLLPNRVDPYNIRINNSIKYNNPIKKSASTFSETESKLDYEKTYHDIFKKSEINIYQGIINKNISLTDIFCYNGMKYHMFASLYYVINVFYKKIYRQTELITLYFEKSKLNYSEINEEYDIILSAILKGFLSKSNIDNKDYNDSKRYNAYLIEYFFYCLSEIKYYINEINYLNEKMQKLDRAILIKFNGRFDNGYNNYDNNDFLKNEYKEYTELKNLFDDMNNLKNEKIKNINIILHELIETPLQRSEEDLSDYEHIYAPKERYYIPMTMKEKWERDLNNPKYKLLEKVEKSALSALNKLDNEEQKEIFSSTRYEIGNNYYFIEKNLLREPDKEIPNKILLEKKLKKNKEKEDDLINYYENLKDKNLGGYTTGFNSFIKENIGEESEKESNYNDSKQGSIHTFGGGNNIFNKHNRESGINDEVTKKLSLLEEDKKSSNKMSEKSSYDNNIDTINNNDFLLINKSRANVRKESDASKKIEDTKSKKIGDYYSPY